MLKPNHEDVLNFLTKYPVVEYAQTNDAEMERVLNKHPFTWQTYYLWTDKIKYHHFQHHLDASMVQGKYTALIEKAVQLKRQYNKAILTLTIFLKIGRNCLSESNVNISRHPIECKS